MIPYVGKEVILGVRPEDLYAEGTFTGKAENTTISAKVDLAELMGSEIYLYLNCEGEKMVARVPSETNIKAEDTVKLTIDPKKAHIFDKDTGKVVCH